MTQPIPLPGCEPLLHEWGTWAPLAGCPGAAFHSGQILNTRDQNHTNAKQVMMPSSKEVLSWPLILGLPLPPPTPGAGQWLHTLLLLKGPWLRAVE